MVYKDAPSIEEVCELQMMGEICCNWCISTRWSWSSGLSRRCSQIGTNRSQREIRPTNASARFLSLKAYGKHNIETLHRMVEQEALTHMASAA